MVLPNMSGMETQLLLGLYCLEMFFFPAQEQLHSHTSEAVGSLWLIRPAKGTLCDGQRQLKELAG